MSFFFFVAKCKYAAVNGCQFFNFFLFNFYYNFNNKFFQNNDKICKEKHFFDIKNIADCFINFWKKFLAKIGAFNNLSEIYTFFGHLWAKTHKSTKYF